MFNDKYKKNLKIKFIVFISFFCLSCTSNNADDIVKGIATEGFTELRFYEEIILQTGNDFIAEIDHVKFLDSYILITDKYTTQQVYLFDKNGYLLHKIGKQGQGPGEYVYPVGSAIINDQIYIISAQTNRIEIYEYSGKHLKSFVLPGIGIWQDLLVGMSKNFYLLSTTRYKKYSISVCDTLGRCLTEFSKIDGQFGYAFDTFRPAGGIALNQDGEVYQVFNHKYKVNVFDKNGSRRKLYCFTSPYYKPPDYEKAKTTHGSSNEKNFRATFTQVIGIYVEVPNIFAIVLRNWKTEIDFEDIVEFWNDNGKFLIRYKLEQGEKVITTYNKCLVFIREGDIDNKSGVIKNPNLILRQISL